MVSRARAFLDSFDLQFKYAKGSTNYVADALSRIPVQKGVVVEDVGAFDDLEKDSLPVDTAIVKPVGVNAVHTRSHTRSSVSTSTTPTISPIIGAKRDGGIVSSTTSSAAPEAPDADPTPIIVPPSPLTLIDPTVKSLGGKSKLQQEQIQEIVRGYQTDDEFRHIYLMLKGEKPILGAGGDRIEITYYTLDEDGLLYRKDATMGKHRLCIPDIPFRKTLMEQTHERDVCHAGRDKTIQFMAARYYWHGITRDVSKFVKNCLRCLQSKPVHMKPQGYLQPLPVATMPFRDLSIDFASGFPDVDGMNNLVIIRCRFSKMVKLIATSTTIDAPGLADIFIDKIFSTWGIPTSIVSDRGSIFTSAFYRQLFARLKVKLNYSTVCHPQTDGSSEKTVSTVRQMLRAISDDDTHKWYLLLPMIEFAINTTVSAATGYTPFELVQGFNPRSLADIVGTDGDKICNVAWCGTHKRKI